ncbi:diguanylate cyclase [Desulfovibrio aminophilus]|nr:diguanylate cyclase [Desulfovibrio aminophilus]MCM0756511.1 diguanylate cyclase [Desulfovibrio aminophilus]
MSITQREATASEGEIFSREERVLRRAREALERAREGRGSPWATLVAEYEKLFRHSRRLVSMGDRMQRTLNELNRRLAVSEERYRGIFENAAEGIFRADPGGRLVEINPALVRMFGFDNAADFFTHADDMAALFADGSAARQYLEELNENGEVRGFQAEMTSPGGGLLWAQISARLLGGNEEAAVVGVLADITERRRMMEEMCRLARTDALTGLWNRGYFMELARHEMARSRRDGAPLSLLMIDADHFKTINDTHGHDAGDEALRTLADCFRRSVREVDVPARFGGEEFVILLPGTSRCGACGVAERLTADIRETEVRCGESRFRLTVSIGATTCADGSVTLDGLLKFADIALYAAKKKGRDRVEAYLGPACALHHEAKPSRETP